MAVITSLTKHCEMSATLDCIACTVLRILLRSVFVCLFVCVCVFVSITVYIV